MPEIIRNNVVRRTGDTMTGDLFMSNNTGIVIGHTSQIAIDGLIPEFQVLGTAVVDSMMGISRFSNNAGGPTFSFSKSRAGVIGTFTIVQDGDNLGSLKWNAADGVDFVSDSAEIKAEVDGTPGADDTPGRLVFSTAADGANTLTERMRISSTGNVLINGFTASTVGLTIKAAASQTANTSEWKDSAGEVIGFVQPHGALSMQGADAESTNLFFGEDAGIVNTVTGSGDEGKFNNFFGYHSGRLNTTGRLNVGLGSETLDVNTDGTENMAIGHRALYRNTEGNRNMAIGSRTLDANITGDDNTAIGNSALSKTTTSNTNTAIGALALAVATGGGNISVGYGSSFLKTTGNNNTVLGTLAFRNNLTGAGNVIIGVTAGQNELGSNKLYIANTNTATPLIYGEFDNALLKINGTFETEQDRVTSTETSTGTGTMADTVEIHICNGSSAYALTLPAHKTDKHFTITNMNTGVVTLTPVSGTILGETTITLSQWESVDLLDDNTNYILG